MTDEDLNKIIDKYMLNFLDEFKDAYDRLPSEEEYRIWMVGFIDGCDAIRTHLTREV